MNLRRRVRFQPERAGFHSAPHPNPVKKTLASFGWYSMNCPFGDLGKPVLPSIMHNQGTEKPKTITRQLIGGTNEVE
jgi:hypothetical protein